MSNVRDMIPSSYQRVAVQENKQGMWEVEVFANRKENTFYLLIHSPNGDQLIGPVPLNIIDSMFEAIKDLRWQMQTGYANLIEDLDDA